MRCISCVVVLDTVRKAHEAELEKERGKFLDVIAKTYCQADMESLQRQHESVVSIRSRRVGISNFTLEI